MEWPLRISYRAIGFREQLVLTFTVGILCLALLSSLAIATLSSRTARTTLLEQGRHATEAFADQSTLALLYQSADNAKGAASATLAFPDILGVGIYDQEHRPLLSKGKDALPPGENVQWPQTLQLVRETNDAWFFIAPVYARQSSREVEESPFVTNLPEPELIGFVRIVMGKDTLKSLGKDILHGNLFVSTTLAAVLLLLLLSITTRMTSPLKNLAANMRRAQLGEKNVRAEVRGPKDIKDMESAFNTMMAVLETRERELQRARDAALKSARIKGEFAANVSHELRTPLNGVLGMLELLQNMGLTPKQREYVQVACNSGETLLQLIGDILDFSRLDSGKLKLDPVDFSLQGLLDDVVGLLGGQAQRKDLELGYVVAENLPPALRGDVARIRQILINLVGNGIKFTERGEVTIGVQAFSEPTKKPFLRFEVKDTGIGISSEAQGRIFEPFSQADSSTTRKYGGTGLGLAICRQLVNSMGGDIGVESGLGQGSIFWFAVPLEAALTPQELYGFNPGQQSQLDDSIVTSMPQGRNQEAALLLAATAEPKLLGYYILIVEDNRANQQVAVGMLERLGCRVDVVSNGQEALEAMIRRSYDLVLMDCHMPGMDGYEATRRYRALEGGSRRQIPIIAMTANVREGDNEKCLSAGMSDYLPKPLKLNLLRDKLQHWLGSNSLNVAVSAADISDIQMENKNREGPLNAEVLSELRASVGDAFSKMIEAFLEDTPIYLDKLGKAIAENKTPELIDLAHGIKGSARNFGATQFAHLAKQLEDLGRSESTEGAQELLAKLVSEYRLVKVSLQHEVQPDKGGALSKAEEQSRVLIVDDDRGMRLALHNVLEQDGYQIDEAVNGEQALALCKRHMPDLVLMDAVMPIVDGFEACARIRDLQGSAHTPVLIITALEDEDSIKQAFSVGASDYIPKPVHFAVLRRRVARLLEASRAEKHVHQLAYQDTLTGLPNRTQFKKHLEELLARPRSEEELVAIFFLDLDRFKLVNDTLGHDVGDLLLKAAADRIVGCLRSGDLVARLGGDEFTIILEGIRSPEVAAGVAAKVCNVLSKPFVFMGQEMYISTSIGIALYPHDGEDICTLIKRADTAMFRAKEQGNSFQFYEQGMETVAAKRLALEADLRRALERQEFMVCYQPQKNLATGKLEGMEALLRWRHPERGLVSPAEFIPLAEDTGLIVPIGEWVLRQACLQMQSWLQRGFGSFRVAVNVSGRELEKGDLVDKVMGVLEETGLPPEFLELEITESVIMKQSEVVIPMFQELREMGIKLAIDDFGTGYSSLNYLKRFSVDTLKIDRSFICDIVSSPDDAAIIASVIALARSLRLKVVAEGVETREQETILKEYRCDLIQGFYLSPPLSAAVAEQTVLRQSRGEPALPSKVYPLRTKRRTT